jgi:beta-galactosidase/beta-glucuronidase
MKDTRFPDAQGGEGKFEMSASGLPRAVTRPNLFRLLDGEWAFSLDLDDRGLREGWPLGHTYEGHAIWPGAIESHISQAKEHPSAWRDKIIAWYEREFECDVPAAGDPMQLQITFGACGYETRVWLNGQLLRTVEDQDVHTGDYTSFSYELPVEHLRPVNRITVRIADSMDAEIPRGKQESVVYKRGGIWYQTYSGPVRSVWLETVERNRLRSRVGVFSVVEDNLVRVNFTTLIHDPGIYTLTVSIFDRDKDAPAAVSEFRLPLKAGQKQQRVVLEVPHARLWSPSHPNLYLLVARLDDGTGNSSQIQTHFGLRKIEARGRIVYLNNQPLYLDGILYQPARSTYEEVRTHMRSMKELGCNLVRVHIDGIDPRICNLADELGLLLWVEVPSPHRSSSRSRENHRAELMRMLALIESHPSIVIWSLYNEDWGAQDIATSRETQEYIVDTYHYMQIHHPQFLVVDNDGWHHVSWEGRLKSDLLTAHLYTPDLEKWRTVLQRLESGELQGVAANPLVVGDPYFYRGQNPLVVSEWGGFGFQDYGGPSNREEKASRIRAFKNELRGRSLAGDVYTQATDIEEERNGLLDARTGGLLVPAGILSSREPR